VSLADDLVRAAAAADAYAGDGERVEAVLAAEPAGGRRVYLCAFGGPSGRAWLALDDTGVALTSRAEVREAVSIAALCEIAGEAAGDAPPRLASPAYLDAHATAEVVAAALPAVEALTLEVEATYKQELT